MVKRGEACARLQRQHPISGRKAGTPRKETFHKQGILIDRRRISLNINHFIYFKNLTGGKVMKKLFMVTLAIGFIVSLSIGPAFGGWDPGEAEQKKKQAEETIARFKEKDPAMQRFFDNAYAFAVYPTVAAGALIVGGAHGTGLVYQKQEIIGKSNITQGSVGLQVGGQSYSEIVFFKDKANLDKLQEGKIKFAAQASAIAATAGASADADYSDGVAVFTLGKGGLMLQASIGGQELTFEPKAK